MTSRSASVPIASTTAKPVGGTSAAVGRGGAFHDRSTISSHGASRWAGRSRRIRSAGGGSARTPVGSIGTVLSTLATSVASSPSNVMVNPGKRPSTSTLCSSVTRKIPRKLSWSPQGSAAAERHVADRRAIPESERRVRVDPGGEQQAAEGMDVAPALGLPSRRRRHPVDGGRRRHRDLHRDLRLAGSVGLDGDHLEERVDQSLQLSVTSFCGLGGVNNGVGRPVSVVAGQNAVGVPASTRASRHRPDCGRCPVGPAGRVSSRT